jgi:hypothetical protein
MRHILITEVLLEGASVSADTQISDITPEGVFIDTDCPASIGSAVGIRFTLPTGHTVSAEGVIVHVIEGVGMGIAFTEITPDDVLSIRNYLE